MLESVTLGFMRVTDIYTNIYIFLSFLLFILCVSFLIKTEKEIYNNSYTSSTPIDLYEILHIFYT